MSAQRPKHKQSMFFPNQMPLGMIFVVAPTSVDLTTKKNIILSLNLSIASSVDIAAWLGLLPSFTSPKYSIRMVRDSAMVRSSPCLGTNLSTVAVADFMRATPAGLGVFSAALPFSFKSRSRSSNSICRFSIS